ncbi:MAG: flagellar motor switch protein FliN [Lachnospiraceae bacterium]|nr:flagellar motor switch protein FliN [Lachnospiraceae bacterium]
MGANSFNAMELDAIGEIMNISLGASATAVSTLLGTKVNITTPVAQVLSSDEFSFKRMEPAVGVNISYVKGLEGNNVMIFRRNDVRVIVGILMGAEIPEDEFVMDDEINVSAVCEVMNQMMGSSATALSEFLGYTVDISTPKSFEITDDLTFKERYFPSGTEQVLVRFTLEIGDVLKSEFMNIMSIDLIKRLLAPFADTLGSADDAAVQPVAEPESSLIQTNAAAEEPAQAESKMPDGVLTQEEIQAMLTGGQAEEPATSAPAENAVLSQEEIQAMLAGNQSEPEPAPAQGGGDAMLSQEEIQAMLAGGQPEASPASQPAPVQQPAYQSVPAAMDPMMMQLMTQMQQSQMQMMEMMNQMQKERTEKPAPAETPRPNTVVHPVNSPKFAEDTGDGVEEAANKELLMKVPLEISVEIGRTRKLVKDILEFTQGSLVVLDKMAGERADVFVNGECIARGDIVVVEDNFGIRITEIVSRNFNPEGL